MEEKVRVLVIDDHINIHAAIKKVIAPERFVDPHLLNSERQIFGAAEEDCKPCFDLECVDNGEEGVAVVARSLVENRPIAVAFVDMRMPGIDGLETVQRIWQVDPRVQIVFLTAYSDHGWEKLNRGLGRHAASWMIIRKSFDPVEVLQAAHAFAAKWQHERDLETLLTELMAARQGAEAANRAKSEFLANMSHDIRTPIHGVLSMIGFCLQFFQVAEEEGFLPKMQAVVPENWQDRLCKNLEFLQNAKASGERLQSLLNNILDLSKIEAWKMQYSFNLESVYPLAVFVADNLRQMALDRGITLIVQEAMETTAEVDAGKMMQIFTNLIGNAIKFSGENCAGKTVTVGFTTTASTVAIQVSDEGVGIPAEYLQEIFDPFTQSQRTKNHIGGTGLGLAICQRYVAAHNGRIFAANRPGRGAVFTVVLPKQQPDRMHMPVSACESL